MSSRISNDTNTNSFEIDSLMAKLSDKDEKARQNARAALAKIGLPAIELLLKQFKNPDKLARWEAAKTLAGMRNPPAAPYLVEALSNSDPDIRWLAAEGLIALGSDGLINLMEALTRFSGNMLLATGVHHVLHDLSKSMVHEGEGEYKPLNPLTPEMRLIVKPVLGSLEPAGSIILTPEYAKIALNQLKQLIAQGAK